MNAKIENLVNQVYKLIRSNSNGDQESFSILINIAITVLNQMPEFETDDRANKELKGLFSRLCDEVSYHLLKDNISADLAASETVYGDLQRLVSSQKQQLESLKNMTFRSQADLERLKEEASYLREIQDYDNVYKNLCVGLEEWPYCLDALRKRFAAIEKNRAKLKSLEISIRQQIDEVKKILQETAKEESEKWKEREKRVFVD